MQKKKSKVLDIAIIGVLVIALLLIRMFEKELFYDPFLDFFHSDTKNKIIPEFNTFNLFLGLLCRYFMNSIFTVLIVYFFFGAK